MIVWHLLLAGHSILIHGGWLVVLGADMLLRMVPPYCHRMRRGKYFGWTVRKFGPILNDLPMRVGLSMTALGGLVVGINWGIDLFYGFLVVTLVIDWITGSEDPPWRRWAKSGAEILKKLRWQPLPEPAVNS